MTDIQIKEQSLLTFFDYQDGTSIEVLEINIDSKAKKLTFEVNPEYTYNDAAMHILKLVMDIYAEKVKNQFMSILMPDNQGFDKRDFQVYSRKYVKKPIEVSALKLECEVFINTLEGVIKGNVGDYLIEGIQGEFYPCRGDIFEKTYKKKEKLGA